mgnify:CR=1 FL=1
MDADAAGRCRAHPGQLRENTMWPRTVRTEPAPWHTRHAPVLTRVTPVPSHARHVSRRVTVTVRSVPLKASSNESASV